MKNLLYVFIAAYYIYLTKIIIIMPKLIKTLNETTRAISEQIQTK